MASRYWVGGTASWDATAGSKWATSSGGASGAAVPTAADDVFFDASSTGTCTLSASSVCRSLNCTGFTGTMTHPASTTVNIGDATAGASSIALKLVAGMTYSGNATGNWKFISTSATVQTIDFASKTVGAVTWDGVAGSWQLTGTMVQSSTSAGCTLTNGTLDTNGQTCTWQSFGLGAGTKTLTMGASAVTISGGSTPWGTNTNGAGFTFNANTSSITFTNANITIATAGITFNNLTWTGAGNCTISGACTFANLTTTSAIGQNTSSLILQADQVITGTWTAGGRDSGTTNSGMLFVCPGVFNSSLTQRTITAAIVSLNNVDFHHIKAQGAAIPFTGTNIGDAANNSNITFSSPRTVYWIGGTGNSTQFAHWATSTGGAGGARPPCANDTAIFDANSFTGAGQTVTYGGRMLGKNIDFSAATNSPTITIAGNNNGIMGGLTLTAGMSITANVNTSYSFLGTGTITTAGVAFGANVQINSAGTVTNGDDFALDSSHGLTFVQGTWDANNKNFSMQAFSATTAVTRTITNMTGSITINGSGTSMNMSDVGVTLTNWSATIYITDTSATAKTVNMPNQKSTFNGTSLNLSGGSGSITIQWAGAASNHLGALSNLTVAGPASLIFPAGQITTLTNAPVLIGSAGNLITMQSGTSGSQFNFSKASGTVSCDYLSLQDSNATGGARWFAGANSTDVSGNTGWVFTVPNYSPTHTTSSNKRTADLVKTHTTSSNKKVAGNTKTHTTDANKKVAALTRTHTTNALKRTANLLTHTTNSNRRAPTTKIHTTDGYTWDRRKYSRENKVSLPTVNTTLATLATTAEAIAMASDDNANYVNVDGNNFLIHQYEYTNTNGTQAVTATWNGQTTTAPSSKTVYLQIWNYTTSAWETLTSNSSTAANTDFTLSATKNSSMSDYYSGNVVIFRVYQGVA